MGRKKYVLVQDGKWRGALDPETSSCFELHDQFRNLALRRAIECTGRQLEVYRIRTEWNPHRRIAFIWCTPSKCCRYRGILTKLGVMFEWKLEVDGPEAEQRCSSRDLTAVASDAMFQSPQVRNKRRRFAQECVAILNVASPSST